MRRTTRDHHTRGKRPRLHSPVGLRLCRPRNADRASLLAGTALVSTLLLACLLGSNSAQAVSCTQPPPPAPINLDVNLNVNDKIICVNTEPRTNPPNPGDPGGNTIELSTIGKNHRIDLYNSGLLTASEAGIFASTAGKHSLITIENVGEIVSGLDVDSYSSGIQAQTSGQNSDIIINNSGDIDSLGYSFSFYADPTAAIFARTYGDASSVIINNDAEIFARESGIVVDTSGANSPVLVTNAAGAKVYAAYDRSGTGIFVRTRGDDSSATVINAGDILADTLPDPYVGEFSDGILVDTQGNRSPIEITNSGTVIKGDYGGQAFLVSGSSSGDDSPITIINTGIIDGPDLSVVGIHAQSFGYRSGVTVQNHGVVNYGDCRPFACEFGISTTTGIAYSPILIENTGEVYAVNLGIAASAK